MTDPTEAFRGELTMPPGMGGSHVTLPTDSLCHYITDDELQRLGHMDQDPVKDICLTFAGIFGGAFVPGAAGFWHFGDQAHPLTGIDLLSMIMAVASLFVIVITAYLWHRRAGERTTLVEKIRKRPKVPVKLVYDNPAQSA